MLRHIISVSLAMTACASLIPTKANANGLTLTPVGSLRRNPGDSIEFIVALNPYYFTSSPDITGIEEVEIRKIYIDEYDLKELSLPQIVNLVPSGTRVNTTTNIARFIFNVLQPVKDGMGDVYARVDYSMPPFTSTFPMVYISGGNDVEPVPEPLTIFGTATALGCGALFKRKSSKKTVS
jgi:hypothetical protein